MLRKLLFLFCITGLFYLTVAVPSAMAQTGSISGTVTDGSGVTVPGANVLLVGTQRGAATNTQGHYSINNVSAGTYTLRVTFIGYKTYNTQVTVEAGQSAIQNVVLQSGSISLSQLVVTGMGRESKIEYTGSVSSVNVSEDIENVPVTNVGSALQGAVSGLNIRANSGTPGSPVEFNIRGVSSVNAGGQPLIILDGIPVRKGTSQYGLSSKQGLLSSIDPQVIESINVLKGPVATAQYGAEGANGVVVITTKRGTAGQTRYSASYQRGIVGRATPFPEMATAKQSAMLYKEAAINAGVPTADIDVPWDGQTNTDWVDLMTRDNPITQQFGISAQGGSSAATFFGSLSYQDANSVVINSGYKRFGGTFNFGYNFSDRINIRSNFTGSYGTLKGIRGGSAYYANPIAAPAFLSSVIAAYDSTGGINLDTPANYNPLWIAKYDISRTRNTRLINSTKLNIDLLKNLTYHALIGIDYSALAEKTYGNPVHGWAADLGGFGRDGWNREFNGSFRTSFDYNLTINENMAFSAKILGIAKMYKYRQIIAAGQGFAKLGLTTLNSASTPVNATSFINDGKLLSGLLKVHYSYKQQLFFDGSIRKEGNSRFAPGHRWGTFFGIGGGWLVSAAPFLNGSDVLTKLKIRASFGESGNNQIGRNQYQSFLGFSSSYNGLAGVYPSQLGNPLVTWERKRDSEVGLSFGILNRINGDVTFFHTKTHDLLYQVPLSRTTGFDSQLTNVGDLVNKGIELSLKVDAVRTNNFLVSVKGNFTYVTNKITKLAKDVSGNQIKITNSRKVITQEGEPIREWKLKTYLGANPKNGKPVWVLNTDPTQAQIDNGTAYKLDYYGGNRWLTSDYNAAMPVLQGTTPTPTHYGSVGLTLNYKGFYAGAMLFGSWGNAIYDDWGHYYQSDGHSSLPGFAIAASQLARWQEPGDHTWVPQRIEGGNNQSAARISTRYLYDGSFLRLKTVRIGYQVPADLLDGLGIGLRGLNIYLIARNIYTYVYDDHLIWDPQVGTTDNGGANPGWINLYNQAQKSYNIGIQIDF